MQICKFHIFLLYFFTNKLNFIFIWINFLSLFLNMGVNFLYCFFTDFPQTKLFKTKTLFSFYKFEKILYCVLLWCFYHTHFNILSWTIWSIDQTKILVLNNNIFKLPQINWNSLLVTNHNCFSLYFDSFIGRKKVVNFFW